MKKLTYLGLVLSPILLSGCQVTGEKDSLYQRVMSGQAGIGIKTKNYALVSSDNAFTITVPISEYNSGNSGKGLIGSNDISQKFNGDWNIKHYYYSTFRSLHDSMSKLNLCHVMTPDNKRLSTSSKSCSEVTLNYSSNPIISGTSITFKASDLLVSTDNYGFIMKNNAPNLLTEDGRVNTSILVSQLAYSDGFRKILPMSADVFRMRYRNNVQNYAENPIVDIRDTLSLSEKVNLNYKCLMSIDTSIQNPVILCKYVIYGNDNNPIYDYRSYNNAAIEKLNLLAKNYS